MFIEALDQYLDCSNYCAVPCDNELFYKTSMTRTVAAFITDVELSENIPTEDVADIIQVDFYYPFIGLTQKITEETTSIFDLIGNLGGQLGTKINSRQSRLNCKANQQLCRLIKQLL